MALALAASIVVCLVLIVKNKGASGDLQESALRRGSLPAALAALTALIAVGCPVFALRFETWALPEPSRARVLAVVLAVLGFSLCLATTVTLLPALRRPSGPLAWLPSVSKRLLTVYLMALLLSLSVVMSLAAHFRMLAVQDTLWSGD